MVHVKKRAKSNAQEKVAMMQCIPEDHLSWVVGGGSGYNNCVVVEIFDARKNVFRSRGTTFDSSMTIAEVKQYILNNFHKAEEFSQEDLMIIKVDHVMRADGERLTDVFGQSTGIKVIQYYLYSDM